MKVYVEKFEFVKELNEMGFSNGSSHILYNYFEEEDVYDYRTIKKYFKEYIVGNFIDMYKEEFEEYKFDYDVTPSNIDERDIIDFVDYLNMKPIGIMYKDEHFELENATLLVKVKL